MLVTPQRGPSRAQDRRRSDALDLVFPSPPRTPSAQTIRFLISADKSGLSSFLPRPLTTSYLMTPSLSPERTRALLVVAAGAQPTHLHPVILKPFVVMCGQPRGRVTFCLSPMPLKGRLEVQAQECCQVQRLSVLQTQPRARSAERPLREICRSNVAPGDVIALGLLTLQGLGVGAGWGLI
ncbi:hypothetical protein CB1_000623002 [Camelus ferus]|nr:hypothetical protein CB1_000623002 [Camelus ferus]